MYLKIHRYETSEQSRAADLRRQRPAQHVLEAEQLLGRVMGPVDRVEDVHLLRHLLGHGVTSKRVNVGVDLGTECGQEVIAVHHLGAASLGLSLQRPGLGEGDCSQGQVAEYYLRETLLVLCLHPFSLL